MAKEIIIELPDDFDKPESEEESKAKWQQWEDEAFQSYRNMDEYKNERFDDSINYHYSMINRIIMAAKMYILDNYEKITDWSDLYTTIHHGINPKMFQRYGKLPVYNSKGDAFDDELESRLQKILRESDMELEEVKTITNAVYDFTDGDFSITVNGKEWFWIRDQSVMDITRYIEERINPKVEEPRKNDSDDEGPRMVVCRG